LRDGEMLGDGEVLERRRSPGETETCCGNAPPLA